MTEIVSTPLEGCYQVFPALVHDERGVFMKTFHSQHFSQLGLPSEWLEDYYTRSHKGVIRGMHFQTPPHDHEKLVYCISGQILDVVVDLRRGSRTYGEYLTVSLDATMGQGLLIPKGLAHGFRALSDEVIVAYKVTSLYSNVSDQGIRWDSFGFDWGLQNPILSTRDQSLPSLKEFESPFSV